MIKTGSIGHVIQQTWDRLDVGLVDGIGKYLRKYRCISQIVTLPHIGSLGRSLATHIKAMALKVILCQSFGKCVSNLVFCVNLKKIYKSLAHMFAKVVVAYVDVLCSRA